jgi:hypothetical protein
MIIPSGTFDGAISGAMQMLTDNATLLLYIFGIPLFLIAVNIVLGWIKSIKPAKTGKAKDNIEYIWKDGRIAGGRKK